MLEELKQQVYEANMQLPRRVGRAKSFLQKNWQNLLTNAPQMAIIISVA